MYLPYTAPHWPLHAFEEDIAKYEGKYLVGWDAIREQRYRRLVELGIVPEKWKLSLRNPQAKNWDALSPDEKKYYDRMMATYAAMIEGGNATPLIAWYPQMIKAGTMDNQVGHVIDLMPTVAELAGARYPKTFNGHDIKPLEGKSLLPVLQGKQRQGHRVLFWNHLGHRAARKGNWKIVSRYEPSSETELPWELYDMVKDRTETNDLATEHPKVVTELEADFKKWFARTGSISHKNLLVMRRKR